MSFHNTNRRGYNRFGNDISDLHSIYNMGALIDRPLLRSDASLNTHYPSNGKTSTHSVTSFTSNDGNKETARDSNEDRTTDRVEYMNPYPSLASQYTEVSHAYFTLIEEFWRRRDDRPHSSKSMVTLQGVRRLNTPIPQRTYHNKGGMNTRVSTVYDVLDIGPNHCKHRRFKVTELYRIVGFYKRCKSGDGPLHLPSITSADVRKLFSTHSVSWPYVHTLRECVIVCVPPVRCIIMYGRLMFGFIESDLYDGETSFCFDSDLRKKRSITWSISSILEESSLALSMMDPTEPTELSILERIFSNLMSLMLLHLETASESGRRLVKEIWKCPGNSLNLFRITELRKRLESLADYTGNIDRALSGLVDSEVEIQNLRTLWTIHWKPQGEDEGAEMLRGTLEPIGQGLTTVLKQIKRESEELEGALQLMELHLASVRNILLKSELGIAIIGISLGLIAAITGTFGMNLKSGWEAIPHLFWMFSAGFILLFILSFVAVILFFKRLRL